MPEQDRARLAAQALATARAQARARGNYPARPEQAAAAPPDEGRPAGADQPRTQPAGPESAGAGRAGGQGPGTGARKARAPRRRQRRDDPQQLSSAIDGLLDEQGWQLAAATGSVFARWAQIVGPDLAAHTRPEGLSAGELTVSAESTAWATQVRLLAAQLVRRLNEELGDGTVQRVRVRGPAPPRQTGQLRVRGGRGPRDTYG
ncbi:MAG TPA: DciA family protein [Streptosporangiaceae bacterium]